MKRTLPSAALVCCLAAAIAPGARGQDIVDYYDPAAKTQNKIEQVRGTIESESPAGITIRVRGGPVKAIPAAEIRYVRYHVPSVPDLDYRRPFSLEERAPGQTREEARKKMLGEALEGYRGLLPRLQEVPAARRYVQYRAARVLALLADDDPSKLDEPIAAFATFVRENPDGWQIVAVLRQLGSLYEAKGDLAAAGEAYAALARLPGVSPNTKLTSEVLSARLLVRAGRSADAEKKLAALDATLSPGDPSKSAVQVFLAQSKLGRGEFEGVESQVRSALSAATEPSTLAAGHNTLGDYFLKKGRPEDAFWEYLRVDVQYPDDREEEAKALFYLAQLFDKVKNDRVRARDCLTRLLDKTQFGGTEYHRKAVAEKP